MFINLCEYQLLPARVDGADAQTAALAFSALCGHVAAWIEADDVLLTGGSWGKLGLHALAGGGTPAAEALHGSALTLNRVTQRQAGVVSATVMKLYDRWRSAVSVSVVEPLSGQLYGLHFCFRSVACGQREIALLEAQQQLLNSGFALYRHAQRAIDEAERMRSAFDQIDTGLVLLDQQGGVISTNAAAEHLLAAGAGLTLRKGTLHATYLPDGFALQAALSHALAQVRGCKRQVPLLQFRRPGLPALIATVTSAARDACSGDAAALMCIVDPSADHLDVLAPLCQLHGLSPVETILASHLVRGKVVAEAAALMRIKEPTARSYLKQIFVKTGTRRQSELVILLLSGLVRLYKQTEREIVAARSDQLEMLTA